MNGHQRSSVPEVFPIRKIPAVARTRRAPSAAKLLKVPRALVDLEDETERTKSFPGDCLEWENVHIRVDALTCTI